MGGLRLKNAIWRIGPISDIISLCGFKNEYEAMSRDNRPFCNIRIGGLHTHTYNTFSNISPPDIPTYPVIIMQMRNYFSVVVLENNFSI